MTERRKVVRLTDWMNGIIGVTTIGMIGWAGNYLIILGQDVSAMKMQMISATTIDLEMKADIAKNGAKLDDHEHRLTRVEAKLEHK